MATDRNQTFGVSDALIANMPLLALVVSLVIIPIDLVSLGDMSVLV